MSQRDLNDSDLQGLEASYRQRCAERILAQGRRHPKRRPSLGHRVATLVGVAIIVVLVAAILIGGM